MASGRETAEIVLALEERQYFGPVLEIIACELTDNEGMTHDMAVVQQAFKDNVSIAEMFYP